MSKTAASPAPLHAVVIPHSLMVSVERIKTMPDCYSWYWYSYGEKCYAFSVDACIAKEECDNERVPPNGSMLEFDEDDDLSGTGTDGKPCKMIVMDGIANIERQDGGVICRFIAEMYAGLIGADQVKV